MNILKKTLSILSTFPPVFKVLIFATFLNQLGNMVQVFLVLYLIKHLHFTLPQASFSFAVFAFSVLGTNLLGGNILDRFGPVRLLMLILLGNGLVLLSFTLFHSYQGILGMCMLWGITFGLYRPCVQTFTAMLVPEGQLKVGFSVYRLAVNLGMSIGPAVGGYLATHSFIAIFIVNGMTNLLAAVVLFFGFYKTEWFHYRSPKKADSKFSLSFLKTDKTFLILLLGLVPVSMVFFQHDSTMAIFLNDKLNLSLQFYGLLFTINTLIIVFCEIPLNVATLSWSPRFSLSLGSFLITLAFFLLLFVHTVFGIILLTILWTVGEMIFYPTCSSYAAELAPNEERGSYMSIFSLAGNLGNFLGPWSGLLILHHFGFSTLWLACGIFGMISVVLYSSILKNASK